MRSRKKPGSHDISKNEFWNLPYNPESLAIELRIDDANHKGPINKVKQAAIDE